MRRNWCSATLLLLKLHGFSKLAQTIVNLRFGWTNGNDSEGRKRVMPFVLGLLSWRELPGRGVRIKAICRTLLRRTRASQSAGHNDTRLRPSESFPFVHPKRRLTIVGQVWKPMQFQQEQCSAAPIPAHLRESATALFYCGETVAPLFNSRQISVPTIFSVQECKRCEFAFFFVLLRHGM